MRQGERADPETVLVRRDDGVVWITLNRPERLNSLAGEMREQLARAITEASSTPGTRVIVITGAGRGFCAGADLDTMSRLLESGDQQGFSRLVQQGAQVVRCIWEAPQPVIAAVNGVAAGAGASLAIACDLRIAAEPASIGFTFNRIGLHPDWGATHFLPRLVGAGRATELILTGRMLSAGDAERIGLFDRVVSPTSFADEVTRLAEELAIRPPVSTSLAKQTLHDASMRLALEEAMRQEAESQIACFRTEDAREGVAAFREKRRPRFRGR